MDESDLDLSFLCSRLLKRVRRKCAESGDEKKRVVKDEGEDQDSGSEIQSRSKVPWKRKREKKEGPESKTTDRSRSEGRGNEGSETGVVREGEQKEQKLRAKEQVLSRMQRFKRVTPPCLVHTKEEASAESAGQPSEKPSPPVQEPVEKQESDNALAQRLQQQLDREVENQAVVNVEDGCLFFCQLCYKDLSAMSHQLRTQHINRCLDERESSTSRVPAPPPRPRVPECPICGKCFKSEKTRSTHLKRCSASMGVSPAELLKALQRQAAERANGQQAVGSSDNSDSSMPVKKKARKKAPGMDEDTMMALALSRSLLEQEMERDRDREEERRIQAQLESTKPGAAPVVVQGRSRAGKSRVKRRKGDPAAPPPLLLVQDPQAAQKRIQERVSSLLLLTRPPTPPTPTLLPSALSTHTFLWLKSALPGGGPVSLSEFYTAELEAFIQPDIGVEKNTSLLSEATPAKQSPAAASESTTAPEKLPDASAGHRPSTPSLGMPGTQALTDLVDLAEEGMTLTQYKSTDAEPHLSGFVPESTETPGPAINSTSVSRLCSDLGSMVNNPQLSDVQLQVDSGDIYYAHSFMLYTRCPLLASMVHDAGFGVQEEGFPRAQRVLLNDVSGKAVYTLLQFLYTAVCHLTHILLPDVLQLARRFGLSELQQQCEQYTGNLTEDPREQERDTSLGHESTGEPQQSLVDAQFLDLLRSMWEHEDGDEKAVVEATRGTQSEDQDGSGDREIEDDRVDEDELNEIYEFAATQRKLGAERVVTTERDDKEEGANERMKDNCSDAEQRQEGKKDFEMEDVHHSGEVDLKPDSNRNVHQRGPEGSLDRSYNHLFSVSWGEYIEPSQTQTQHLDLQKTPTSRPTSSVSEVIDLSVSPPLDSGEPARLLFPVTGVSPGETPDQIEAVKQTSVSPKAHCISQLTSELGSKHPSAPSLRKSQLEVTALLHSSTKPKLSSPTPNRSQPELIVLSDSSDDMEPDLPDKVPSRCDAPRPPILSPSRLSLRYTQNKAKEATQAELSPKRSLEPFSSVHPEPSRMDQVGNENVLDGSAEVSWLIPATPEHSTRTRTTQTSISMRRTQLFPRSHSSSSSSISDSSKATSCSNSLKPHREHSQPSPAFQKLTSHSRLSKTSQSDSVDRTYPNSASAPCSSTPLHSDPRLQHLDALGSPLLRDSEPITHRTVSQERRLGSCHLSPLENSLSPQQSSKSEMESSKSPAKSQRSDNPGDSEDQETSTDEKELVEKRTSKTNEAEVMEEEFCFVFDEPPIAFNDSWGLGGAVAEQGPCFSLRLESSGAQTSPPEESGQGETASPHTFSPPLHGAQDHLPDSGSPLDHRLPDAAMWDSWKEDEEEVEALPLSQRVGSMALAKRVSQLRTPVACKKKKNHVPLVPITPMPSFSDMDTPELKNKLNRYGVRPLPKKQMVLKLKEIHQYTHQLMSSGSDEETSPRAAPAAFKQPTAPPPVSPRKLQFGQEEDEQDALPASQESNTSSTAESERSNPEVCDSDDDRSDSDDITASQAAVREKDKLQAVRSFILSDPVLYSRVLQYQPLALCDLKAGLRTAGVRLGTAKLLDFLDSQCITFTTAKQGHPAPSRRRAGRGRKRLAKAAE
ncbi:structure-specific endonuclease subunit SLX4 isoform X1 [Tachysurus vachellii]|uniref:structure-specific endonuclease subunit SLX4 isoform X1 n=1 Tax=Tachysurus vachellii TaxID=175792 RepID=UPI00296B23F6|nr:structure-specific endonuclease subunit SLX4 isoform X1 [Tachysurus vachellii]